MAQRCRMLKDISSGSLKQFKAEFLAKPAVQRESAE